MFMIFQNCVRTSCDTQEKLLNIVLLFCSLTVFYIDQPKRKKKYSKNFLKKNHWNRNIWEILEVSKIFIFENLKIQKFACTPVNTVQHTKLCRRGYTILVAKHMI